MKYLQRIALLLVVSSNLVGCVPIPSKNIETPNVSGVLTEDGVGLEGYSIQLAYGVSDSCSVNSRQEVLSTITDKEGAFIFKNTYKWSLVRWALPLDGIDYFNLCIIAPDGRKKWAYIPQIRTPSWAPDIKLSCENEKLLLEPKEVESGFKIKPTCEEVRL
ncbi:hypothetical protein [Veronia nyctiphanis]|nr:hypothetical protein [Veronia nyctiphanis]